MSTETYTVIRRSTNSYNATGKGEILNQSDREHGDLALAFTEAAALTLQEPEGSPRWIVEDANGEEIDFVETGLEIGDDAVYDYLVDVLGMEEAEAALLTA